MIKGKNGLDLGGISLEDQAKLIPHIPKMKYQASILTRDGKKRFLLVDSPEMAVIYCKQEGAKILKTGKLKYS